MRKTLLKLILMFLFIFFKIANRKIKITYEAHIPFPLDSTALKLQAFRSIRDSNHGYW